MSERGAPLRPEDPTHVGEYELLGRLGAGGMGVVYRARARDGRPVAVKVVHAELAGDGEFRSRFRSEVARARQVPPFCTAEVLDADPEAARPYLVVEFVDGPSLAEEIARRGPLSAANLHGLAIGVATALAAIHDAGVIHRDLKPHNVLLAPGSPKVIDFGIARALDPTTQHTRTGQFVGTISYMAPERFGAPGSPVTPAADVFAWGCVVAYAARGKPPFDADSSMAVFARIMKGEATLDGLTGTLRTLVQRALDPAPERRPTARELVEALLDPTTGRSAVLDDVFARQPEMRTAVHEVRSHPVPATGRRSGSRGLFVTLAVLVLILAASLGFLVRLDGDSSRTRDVTAAQNSTSAPAASSSSLKSSSPTSPAATSPAPTSLALTLPSGKLEVDDPLVTTGDWKSTTSVQDGKTYCRFTDDGLRIQNLDPGNWLCQGPDLELKGGYAVELTGRIEQAGSCLATWFAETSEKLYRLDVCAGSWRLQAENQVNGDSTLLHRWTDASAAVGHDVHLQILVGDGVVRVGHDGVLVGEQSLGKTDDLLGAPFSLGVVSEPDDKKGPFRVLVQDLQIRSVA